MLFATWMSMGGSLAAAAGEAAGGVKHYVARMPDALKHLFARVTDVVKHAGLWWGLAISIGLGLASLVVAAAVVVSWTPDHFKDAHRPRLWARHPRPLRLLGMVAKNLAGVVMFAIGFIMALPGIPGQGILTMIIAVTLIDLPGKHELERRLVGRPFVLRQLNAIRRRFQRPPLEVGPATAASDRPPAPPRTSRTDSSPADRGS
jgi:hypothetical protein